MQKIVPCLWFDGDAEEAAAFYVTLFPDSRIDRVVRSPADNPSMKKGGVLVVDFTLDGQKYTGLNGGPSSSLPRRSRSRSIARTRRRLIGCGTRSRAMAASRAPAAGSATAGASPGRSRRACCSK